jgi:hypothetical protein
MVTHEMPERPAVASGAETVDFPWNDAVAAVAALDAAANELTAHIETRGEIRQTITEWKGPYREGHDGEYHRLTAVLWGLVGALVVRAGAIVAGAEDAAAQQLVHNTAVTDRDLVTVAAP